MIYDENQGNVYDLQMSFDEISTKNIKNWIYIYLQQLRIPWTFPINPSIHIRIILGDIIDYIKTQEACNINFSTFGYINYYVIMKHPLKFCVIYHGDVTLNVIIAFCFTINTFKLCLERMYDGNQTHLISIWCAVMDSV